MKRFHVGSLVGAHSVRPCFAGARCAPLQFALLFTLASAAFAQETKTRPVVNRALTLSEAVEIALRESPVIRGAQAEVEMATAQVQMAQAAKRPTLSATTLLTTGSEFGTFTTPPPVMPQNIFTVPRGPFANQNLMFMLPLRTGGRLQALVKQAQAARGASAAELQTMKLDLALEVKNAYRQTLLAGEMLRVAEERKKATEERLRVDRAAFAEGRVPQLYVLRDEAEDADAAQAVTDAQRDLDLALLMLRTTLGVSAASQITLGDTLSYEAPTTTALPDLLAQAQKQRPEIEAARRRLESAEHNLKAVGGAYQPQVSLMAMGDVGHARGGGAMGGTAAGLVVGVPILNGGMRRAQESEARAGQSRAQAEIEKLTLQIERETQSALLTAQAAEKNIQTAQAAVKAAEENYRLAGLRYEAGRGTNAEVLDALAALTRARGNLARALFEFNAARDQLQRALGAM